MCKSWRKGSTDDPQKANVFAGIQAEERARRSESVKHFVSGPSAFVAADYGMPVHYRGPEGWLDYDNRLELKKNKDGKEEYRNRASDISITLAPEARPEKMAGVGFGESTVAWSYEGVSNAALELARTEKSPDIADLPNLTQLAWYRNAFKEADIEYILSPMGIKENIILKSPQAPLSYTAVYRLKGVSARQEDHKNIVFLDSQGRTVYRLNAPLMQDAAGVFDSRVTLVVTHEAQNQITVRLEICGEWLREPGRAFPVKVDPGFITSQKYDSMDTSWISSGHPTEVLGRSTENMSVGSEMNGYGKTRALVKLRSLPQLSPGDSVVDARLMLAESACLKNMVVYAHRITSGWSPETLCWNTGVTYDPIKLDYVLTDGYNESLKARSWNITALMREWYSGAKPNYGVMLVSPSEDSSDVDRVLFSTGLSSIPAARPVFAITYRHTHGTEKYWTYHTQRFASGASASVNDSTGNLVVKVPMAQTNGTLLPAEFSMVYNSNASYSEFRPGTSSHITGCGWMASSDCRVDPVENLPGMSSAVAQALKNQGYSYAVTDADGTIHYLMHDHDYVHKDEDGLGLTMTWDPNTNYYQVTSKDGTMTEFFTTGKIRRVVDSSGNTKWWQYEGPKLYNIKDGAGKNIKVNYATSGSYTKINSVTDPGGRNASITYSSNCIAKLTNTEGITRTFEYKDLSAGGKLYKLLTKVYDYDGSSTEYIYEESGTNGFKGRVKEIREYDALKAPGRIVKITYNNDNSTTFATTVNGTTVTETYVFDNFGRTKCILYGDGTAVNCDYTNGDSGSTPVGQIYKNNKIANTGNSGAYVRNLLKNQYMSTSDSWSFGSGASRKTSSHALLGDQCAVCTSTDHRGVSYVYQEAAATGGKTYTASAYMHAEGMSIGDAGGARVWMDFYNGTALLSSAYGIPVKGNFDRRRVTCTATVPAGANKIRVHFGIETAMGTVYASGFQLEQSAVANDFSMLTNYNGRGNWTGANLAAGDGVQSDGTVKISGRYNVYSNVYEHIPVKKVNPTFNISAMVKANAVPTTADDRVVGFSVRFFYTDGTVYQSLSRFNPESTGWQYLSAQAAPPAADASKTVDRIGVYLFYEHECNTAYFKDIMVTLDTSGTAYTYDNSGNLISAKDNARNKAAFTFNTANELTKLTDIKNESYTYTYSPSNAHRLIAARSGQLGNGFVYGYDSVGNVTNTKMGTVSTAGVLDTSKPYIESSRTYNGVMNHITSITDQRGNKITYTVNEDTGLVTAAKLPSTTTLRYEYYPDSHYLKRAYAGGVSVGYTYKHGDKIGTVTRSGFNYEFFYDGFSRVSSIKAGGHKLIDYTYGPNRGPVKTAAYGNGSTVGYTYDSYGRVIGATLNGAKWYTNEYDLKGRLMRTKDLLCGKEWNYSYDLLGRLELACTPNEFRSYVYDAQNRITKAAYTFGGGNRIMNYTYGKDGRMGTAQPEAGPTYTFSYDSLNRLYQKKIGAVLQDISYVTAGGQKTTTLVENYSNSVNEAVKYYTKYAYDNMGYITKVQFMGGQSVEYGYDGVGQLNYCKDSRTQSLMKYAYDANGNRTARIVCDYATGAERMRETYEYGDATWKDLLTKYGNATIAYDAIGNPTSYLNLALVWTGRRLDSVAQPSGQKITYQYDSSGMRLSKNVYGVATEYGYADGRLIYQGRGSQKAFFEYDSEGNALAMIYSGVRYVYLKNAQDDIMGLRSESDGKIILYRYDEWGRMTGLLNENGSMVETEEPAALFNPLRFRGYVYDEETGWYYLNSRYYDPTTGRFLNPDSIMGGVGSLKEYNLFAYSFNSPISFADGTGTYPIEVGQDSNRMKRDYSSVYSRKGPQSNAPISGNRPATSIFEQSSSHDENRRPNRGKPGSKFEAPNGDWRIYGPDTRPKQDYDHDSHDHPELHPQDENGGHYHEWDWDKVPPRQPPHAFSWEPLLGAGLVFACGVGLLVVAADNLTGIGVGDDFLAGPLGAGLSQGLFMIMG